jgi:hypothetical protein
MREHAPQNALREEAPTIRQIAEAKVLRRQQGGLPRQGQIGIGQKDDMYIAHSAEWRPACDPS